MKDRAVLEARGKVFEAVPLPARSKGEVRLLKILPEFTFYKKKSVSLYYHLFVY